MIAGVKTFTMKSDGAFTVRASVSNLRQTNDEGSIETQSKHLFTWLTQVDFTDRDFKRITSWFSPKIAEKNQYSHFICDY